MLKRETPQLLFFITFCFNPKPSNTVTGRNYE